MEQIVVLAVLILMVTVLLTGKASLGWVGLLIPCIFTIAGITTAGEAFKGLTEKSIFIFVGAFVLSEAFFQVGLAAKLGKWMKKRLAGVKSERVILLILCLFTAALSSVLSSLGVQVAMLALVLAIGKNLKISKTKSMMAIGYAATIGGTMTLIGSPLNMVGRAAYENAVPGDTIGIFEISIITVPLGLIMILYFCFVGSRYLPDRRDMEEAKSENQEAGTRKNQAITAITFICFIVLIALDGVGNIPSANVISALVLLTLGAFRILTVRQMVLSIRWDILIFVMGIQCFALAVQSTGIDSFLSEHAARLFAEGIPDWLLIAGVFLVVALITQFLNNTGTFGVALPFVLVLASSLDVSLKPVIMTAMIASSCSFALPVAAPTFPMLAKEGDIRVKDWLIQGLPLILIGFLACVIFVPALWPL